MTVQIAVDSLGKALKEVMAQKYLWKSRHRFQLIKA